MKRKRRKAALMPRLGPAQNLRPAGAHESRKRYNRKRAKAALKRYDEDGFFVRYSSKAVWAKDARGIFQSFRRQNTVSRFPAELIVTLTDGRTITECFNQSEMAHFMRESMLECLRAGEPVVVFDGERVEIPASRVASVQVLVQNLLTV